MPEKRRVPNAALMSEEQDSAVAQAMANGFAELNDLLAGKELQERRVITMIEVAVATGINQMTRSRIASHPGYNTGTDNLDRLSAYFGCWLEELAQHIPEEGTGP